MLGLGALRYVMLENDVGHWTEMFVVLMVSKKTHYHYICLSIYKEPDVYLICALYRTKASVLFVKLLHTGSCSTSFNNCCYSLDVEAPRSLWDS